VLGGFEAALVFVLLIMPGVLLVAGYYAGVRAQQGASGSALHGLTQAIAWSVVLLIPALIVTDVENWIADGELNDHVSDLLVAAYVTMVSSFIIGIAVGCLARDRPKLAKLMGTGSGFTSVAPAEAKSADVKVFVTDAEAPIQGQLKLIESRLIPGSLLTIRGVKLDGTRHDVIVPSEHVERVAFVQSPQSEGDQRSGAQDQAPNEVD
jgi:hypothetical protein